MNRLVNVVLEDEVDVRDDEKNEAKELIEDFMIAANSATAVFLKKHGFPSLRRVVRVPKRWDRIVKVAEEKVKRERQGGKERASELEREMK